MCTVAAVVVAPAVAAEQQFSGDVMPTFSLAIHFGSAAPHSEGPDFRALFEVRSRRLSHSRALAAPLASAPSLTVFEFAVNREGLGRAQVLGNDVLGMTEQPNEDVESVSDGSGQNWIWWTAGTLAAVAAIALAAGEDDHGNSSAGDTGNGGDCVGMDTAVGSGGVVDTDGPSVNPGEIDVSGCPVSGGS